MSYKTIAIVISDEVGDKKALQAAITFADREGGHLDVYCLGIDPVRYDMAPMGASPALTLSGNGEAQARAKTLADWAQDRLRGALAPTAVQKLVVTSAGLDAAIARVVRYSDLIIVSQPYGEGSTQVQTIILEAVLFGTGAPVMVIPRTAEDIGSFDRVMVAWDESTQALEAVRKALPSHSPERSDPGGVICVMLARHGVKADVSILAKTMPLVAEVINRHAQDHAIDLIVMGAYGHSRFREAMIGGATRDMLETARLPILMAH
jgi:nucleotide-binding universal stress UspA family protein